MSSSSGRESGGAMRAEELLRLLDAHSTTVIYIRQISPPKLVFVNAAYETTWGQPRQEVLDDYAAWTRSIHPADRARILAQMQRSWSGPEAHDFEFRIIRPDGQVRWLRNRTVIGELDQLYAVGVAEDVTESHRSREMLAAQHEVLESIANGDPLLETLELLCNVIERLAPDTRASILKLDTDGKTMRHAAAPNLPPTYTDAVDGMEIGPEVGSCGTAMYRGEMVIVEDISTHPYWAFVAEFSLENGVVACWSNPIKGSSENILGSFALYPADRRAPSPDEFELLDTASHLAAIAIERDLHISALQAAKEKLEDAVRSRTRELRTTNDRLENEMHERQVAIEALAESESRFRTLVQSVPGVVYRCKLDEDWTMLFMSEGAKAVSGYSAEEFLAAPPRSWGQLIHPDDRAMVERIVEDSISVRQSFVAEYRIVHKDSSIRWMFERGRAVFDGDEVLYLDGVILDVTPQRQMQEAVRESELRFRRLADEAPMLVWMTNDQRKCEFCNRAWVNFTGRDMEDLLGDGWLDTIHTACREPLTTRLQASAAKSEPLQMECTMTRFDGEERIMLVRGTPRESMNHDHFGGFIGTAVDITELRAVEEESRRRETEVAHALRLATVGEMASAVAHELNQPLTSISNYATGALRRLQHGEITTGDLLKVLKEVDELARKGGKIIRRVRSLVQQRTPQRGATSLVPIIDSAIQMLASDAADARAKLELQLASGVDAALVDAVQFEQVLVNLIRNAIDEVRDANPANRTIQIRTESVPQGGVAVEVIDHGRGMQLEKDDVFQPFRTTKSQGMGLGLSISRSIVEAHGGELSYHKGEPSGSRFRIELPPPVADADEAFA